MDFGQVADKVFTAYSQRSYREGVEVIRLARSELPERDSTLTFWEACLLSLAGEPVHALETLESGLDRGLSWDPRMLADPDLDVARDLAGWEDFERRSASVVESLALTRPARLIREVTDPVGTVVALHGAGQEPDVFFAEWDAAIPSDWAVVAPIGDVPVSGGKWAWPFDLATDSLAESLADLTLSEPVVMIGYSLGARLAAKAAWDGLLDVSGLILVAAALSTAAWTESRQRPVPLYVVAGTEDFAHKDLFAVSAKLEWDGVPVYLDIRAGLGHERPPDLARTIRAGLDWIEAQTR